MAAMPDSGFPPMAGLLPHRGCAILLERVLEHDATTTVCSVDLQAGAAFRSADGSMPAPIGLEYMAQAIAAHGGLLARSEAAAARAAAGECREAGEPAEPRPGFFVGARRVAFKTDRFEAGRPLVVTARHLRGTSGLIAFDCSIRGAGDAEPMVSGVLTVYLLKSFEELVEDFSTDD